jgi:hypothetical protein
MPYPGQPELEQIINSILPMVATEIPPEKVSWIAQRIIEAGWHRNKTEDVMTLDVDLYTSGNFVGTPIGDPTEILGKGSKIVVVTRQLPKGQLKGIYEQSTRIHPKNAD